MTHGAYDPIAETRRELGIDGQPPDPPPPADPPPPDGYGEDQAAAATPPREPNPYPTFGVHDLGDLPGVEWLIDGAVQEFEGTLIYGARGAGKSLVALDMLCHIAAGMEWQGRAVKQRPVLLVVLENRFAIGERVGQWHDDHPEADLSGMRFLLEPTRATDDEAVARLHDTIVAQLDGGEVAPVVAIDTKQRWGAGLDENSGKDMQELIDVLDDIRHDHGCTVVLVDHSGKDQAKGTRGHTSLEASFTAVHQIAKGDGPTLRCEKNNNGPERWEHAWTLYVGAIGPALRPARNPRLAKRDEDIRKMVDLIRTTLPDGGTLTKIRTYSSMKHEAVPDVLEAAVAEGHLRVDASGRYPIYFVDPGAEPMPI